MKDKKFTYTSSINEVQNYIYQNLESQITLEDISRVSGFSKYHFSRLYKTINNETLSQYIIRIKLENALYYLSCTNMSITDIALELGFSDSTVFARAFKRRFGICASNVRKDSKNCKAINNISIYNEDISSVKGRIEVKDIDGIDIGYIRHTGPYKDFSNRFAEMLNSLINWGRESKVLSQGIRPMTIYHDHPYYTTESQLKTSIGILIDRKADTSGDICTMKIPAGKFAIGHFEVSSNDIPKAWHYMCGEWLISSGFLPNRGDVFEVYMNGPSDDVNHKWLIDIYVPIKKF